jgi:hypothetical protein
VGPGEKWVELLLLNLPKSGEFRLRELHVIGPISEDRKELLLITHHGEKWGR